LPVPQLLNALVLPAEIIEAAEEALEKLKGDA